MPGIVLDTEIKESQHWILVLGDEVTSALGRAILSVVSHQESADS